jgi:hypothetical protein
LEWGASEIGAAADVREISSSSGGQHGDRIFHPGSGQGGQVIVPPQPSLPL